MFKTLGTVFSLLLSYGLLLLANGLFSTLLGVRTQVEGFSATLVGFIVASYFGGLLLGGLFAASDRRYRQWSRSSAKAPAGAGEAIS